LILLYLSRCGVAAPAVNHLLHVIGYLTLQVYLFTCQGMDEPQCAGMQTLTRAGCKAVVNKLFVFGEVGAPQYFVATISFIVEEGVADLFHVYPYLVGTAGLQTTFNQSDVAEPFQHAVVRHRRFTLFPFGKDPHYHPVFRVATDVAFNGAAILSQVAPYQCHVETLCLFVEELRREMGFRFRSFCHQ